MSLHTRRDNSKPPLQQENSKTLDYTVNFNSAFVVEPLAALSPGSAVQHQSGYHRITSLSEQDTAYYGPEHFPHPSEDIHQHGLGIKASPGDRSSPVTPASTSTLLSPPPAHSQSPYGPVDNGPKLEGNRVWEDNISMTESYQPFVADLETESLRKNTTAPTLQSFEPPEPECRAKRRLHYGKANWLAVSVMVLSVYSTLLSGLWLGVALAKPRFGHRISNHSSMPPATASLVAAIFAKTIELSLVTVFVTFLGQVLSRRALVKNSRGITISEMSMRQWIMQPGTMITHWQTFRYAALTFLGFVSLLGALTAMLYTTASDALVAPQLKMGPLEHRWLYGKVATSFANEQYIQQKCQTPIPNTTDPQYGPSTCIAIEHSGQAYHNYMQYLSNWTNNIAVGILSGEMSQRPLPLAMLYDNTTVQGSWIHVDNMTEISQKYSNTRYNRTVVNVTMAMPHAGVFAATRDPINNILQPQDLNGLGEYDVHASVPSPITNVLCASMQREELVPIVFSEWPTGKGPSTNLTGWPNSQGIPKSPSWLNRTSVDDLFGFGEKYRRRPPVFPKLPLPYNTVSNDTGNYIDSIYILATSATGDYTMCSMRASITTRCSTQYHASLSGGSLNAHCEDSQDSLAYGKSYTNATEGVIATDWADVATEWALALSLNAGINDAMASNARLLSQLIPTDQALNPSLPSIAEALAVLSGCTLLLSSIDSPFIHYWNYSTTVATLAEPQYQAFPATVRTREYASGGTQRWQGIFYLVLFLTFATNVFCLIYFIVRHGLVADFIEPQNLFALSLNSPPSHALDGACGGGPEGEQLIVNWHIKMDLEREHFYIQNRQGTPDIVRRRRRPLEFEMDTSPVMKTYNKLSSKHSSIL